MMYKQILIGLHTLGFLQSQISLQCSRKMCLKLYANNARHAVAKGNCWNTLTCYNDLGIIGLHVAIVHPCPLSLPLFLGFLSIERICVVFQDNQLWGEYKPWENQKLGCRNHSGIYLGEMCVSVCMHVCVASNGGRSKDTCAKRSEHCVCLFSVTQCSFTTLYSFTGWKLNTWLWTNRWGGKAMNFGPKKFLRPGFA